jgi:4-amino-4-deoxy-L-arabinose transferase-like glycosyltransferase
MKSMSRKTLAVSLLAIMVLLVLLRVFNVGHVLGYDEAWNTNSVMDLATGHTGDVFYNNFLRHPPLYTGLGATYALLTGAGRVGVAQGMEVMSLIFAAALVVVIFLCGRDWFGDLAGLSAAFLFAVMPAARAYDTLVKQESMTLLFGMLFVLFFFREKYLLSGAFLGCAMLSKEIFIFAPVAVFLFILATRRYGQIKWFFASLGIGAAVSFWWYLFVSRSKGEFLQFFLGRSLESRNWRQPWHYYLRLIPADLGWVAAALAVAGVVFLALADGTTTRDMDTVRLHIPFTFTGQTALARLFRVTFFRHTGRLVRFRGISPVGRETQDRRGGGGGGFGRCAGVEHPGWIRIVSEAHRPQVQFLPQV